MRLECEREGDGYRLFGVEGESRWELLTPGTPPNLVKRLMTRQEAFSAALLAGFSKRQIERALGKADRTG